MHYKLNWISCQLLCCYDSTVTTPVTTTSKPATTNSTAASSKPVTGSGTSSDPASVASVNSSISTESKVESAASSGVEIPQYTVSESSEVSTVPETSSSLTGQSKDNSVNIATIVIIVIIVCGGAAFIILRKRKIASSSMDNTQIIDISSKRK